MYFRMWKEIIPFRRMLRMYTIQKQHWIKACVECEKLLTFKEGQDLPAMEYINGC